MDSSEGIKSISNSCTCSYFYRLSDASCLFFITKLAVQKSLRWRLNTTRTKGGLAEARVVCLPPFPPGSQCLCAGEGLSAHPSALSPSVLAPDVPGSAWGHTPGSRCVQVQAESMPAAQNLLGSCSRSSGQTHSHILWMFGKNKMGVCVWGGGSISSCVNVSFCSVLVRSDSPNLKEMNQNRRFKEGNGVIYLSVAISGRM